MHSGCRGFNISSGQLGVIAGKHQVLHVDEAKTAAPVVCISRLFIQYV